MSSLPLPNKPLGGALRWAWRGCGLAQALRLPAGSKVANRPQWVGAGPRRKALPAAASLVK